MLRPCNTSFTASSRYSFTAGHQCVLYFCRNSLCRNSLHQMLSWGDDRCDSGRIVSSANGQGSGNGAH